MTPMFNDGKRLDMPRSRGRGARMRRVATGEHLHRANPDGNRAERREYDRQFGKVGGRRAE